MKKSSKKLSKHEKKRAIERYVHGCSEDELHDLGEVLCTTIIKSLKLFRKGLVGAPSCFRQDKSGEKEWRRRLKKIIKGFKAGREPM